MQAALINQSHKIAWALLLALPAILPFIRRAGPVVLVLAACLTLVPIILRGQLRDLMWQMVTPTTMLIAAFLGWAFITLLWTPVPARGFHSVASATLMALSGLVLVHGLERLDPSTIVRWLATSIAIGASIVAVDLVSGGYLLKLIHSRPEPYRYNMVLVSLVALSFGLFCQVLTISNPLKYGAILFLLAAAFASESETAKLTLLMAYLALALSIVAPRAVSLWVFLIGIIAAWTVLLLKPEILNEGARFWPTLAEHGHASERIEIWIAYSKMAFAGLPFGWGVESVSNVSGTTYFATVSDALKTNLDWLHPHNNFIQISVEMGWPGILLSLAGSFALVIWAHSDEALRRARVGLVSAIFIVTCISHGFWQMWWWSAAGISLCILTSAHHSDRIK